MNFPIKRVSIYDMDGCIVSSLHRYRVINGKIDLQHWRENQHLAMRDSLLPMAQQYKKDIADLFCYVIIATARELHEPDLQFIREVLGQPDYIIGRKVGDCQGGADLKIKGLQKFFNLVNFPSFENWVMYEDNAAYLKKICDTFKIRGVYIPSEQGH